MRFFDLLLTLEPAQMISVSKEDISTSGTRFVNFIYNGSVRSYLDEFVHSDVFFLNCHVKSIKISDLNDYELVIILH